MKRRAVCAGLLALWSIGSAFAQALPLDAQDPASDTPVRALLEQGLATWYGGQRWQGRRTASGERFDRHRLTAAHPHLPLGTWLRVVHLGNGREVRVRINDRGPLKRGFVIDLSEAAAQHLGFRSKGRAKVALYRSSPPHTAEPVSDTD